MKLPLQQKGSGQILAISITAVVVGILAYLLISSTSPTNSGLFGIINPKPASYAAGNQYFVDCTGGLDSNSGTSQTSAWKNASTISGRSFSPGDTVSFKRGCSWNAGFTIDSSGISDNPITFTTYGTGSSPSIGDS